MMFARFERPHLVLGVFAMLLASAPPSDAQTGGAYELTRNSIDGGGATFSTGGSESLGGTIGQPDAGRLAGGTYVLNGGFWAPAAPAAPTATPSTTGTVQLTVSATPTPSSTPTPSATATVSTPATPPTTVASGTPTRTLTAALSPSASATPSPTASSTPSPTASPARGDANCDGRVSAADFPALITNVVDGERAPCQLDDVNGDTRVDSSDIQPLIDVLFGGP